MSCRAGVCYRGSSHPPGWLFAGAVIHGCLRCADGLMQWDGGPAHPGDLGSGGCVRRLVPLLPERDGCPPPCGCEPNSSATQKAVRRTLRRFLIRNGVAFPSGSQRECRAFREVHGAAGRNVTGMITGMITDPARRRAGGTRSAHLRPALAEAGGMFSEGSLCRVTEVEQERRDAVGCSEFPGERLLEGLLDPRGVQCAVELSNARLSQTHEALRRHGVLATPRMDGYIRVKVTFALSQPFTSASVGRPSDRKYIFLAHNEQKVTCKHPITGSPSQDTCIFILNEQPAPKAPASEKKDRPISTMTDASNYTSSSDYIPHPGSPRAGSSKKVHNFGKRSNSIKRNPNAPVVRSGWLYKQDSAGMKLWKKRWFVLSDMCLFYYRDEKEEVVLGSILLPSFHISMLSVEDHISKKYAFKATHPNMRTYYFCTDVAKDMEAWMRAMTDRRPGSHRANQEKLEPCLPQEANSTQCRRARSQPEVCGLDRSQPEVCGLDRSQPEVCGLDRSQPEVCGLDRSQPEVCGLDRSQPEVCGQDWPREAGGPGALEQGQADGERGPLRPDGVERERPRPRARGARLQPGQAAAIVAAVMSCSQQGGAGPPGERPPAQRLRGLQPGGWGGRCPARLASHLLRPHPGPSPDGEKSLQRTSSMQQLEQWVRLQRGRIQEDDTDSVASYLTLPRKMPSQRSSQGVPHYPEGYRTLPRNSVMRPGSVCSLAPSLYDRALGPTAAEKRRSMRDDTMWQLYEWRLRQSCPKHAPLRGSYSTLPNPRSLARPSDRLAPSIPLSPSHGSLAHCPPLGPYAPDCPPALTARAHQGAMTMDRRHRTHVTQYVYPPPDRRNLSSGVQLQPVSTQSLQGKTPEELTLLLIKLRRQQADLSTARQHTLAQLLQISLHGNNPKPLRPCACRVSAFPRVSDRAEPNSSLTRSRARSIDLQAAARLCVPPVH
ncbi:hypothetical protein COCON_G00228690 [Conger conger]|uniref:PH domain-containing protein n=1 Tax=Conger conger TaxID=82655 RepID=A0A9Q1CV58_CONCO|nr:hypothetical protein COCON_G00228690 [Conger conger]